VPKQDVAQPGELRLPLLRGRQGRGLLTLPACTPPDRGGSACDGRNEVDGLRLAEWLQRQLADRQVAPQVREPCGKLRVERQPFAAQRAKPQHPAAMLLPEVAQVAQQVEGGHIRPVQVIHEQHQWRRPGQGVEEPRHRFEEPPVG
jgi:hypothetical protein